MQSETWDVVRAVVEVTLLIAGASWIGKGFLDRYLTRRQEHSAALEEKQQEHTFDMEKTKVDLAQMLEESVLAKESQAMAALVEMTARQSEAQIELTKEALGTLNLMTENIAGLSTTIRSTNQESDVRHDAMQRDVTELCNRVDRLDGRLDEAIEASRQTEQKMKDMLRALVSSSPDATPAAQEAASKL